MGLAGPKKRIKLSHDPNNTTWTNNTESFGHKLMTAQGWQPGQYLGATNAAHAEFHTEANASHIRVSIKDDNLGLGAKIGSGVGHGECTGLDVFKNILGRLNGKDEDELEKEQRSREDIRTAIYTERKWGTIRFVPGGFLIGDKIQKLIDGEQERLRKLNDGSSNDSSISDSSSESEEEKAPAPVEKVKKSKKRKAEHLFEKVPEVVTIKVERSKKDKKKHASVPQLEEDVTTTLKDAKLSKKSKKDRKSKGDGEDIAKSESSDSGSNRRKREKKEKERLKAEKRELKEKKTKSLEADGSSPSNAATKESTPLTAPSSGRSTPMVQGRHAVRARNIAQKRMASMDVASLNQIFMIKS
ncbi:hypothetical protein BJ875DRAFT_450603 [Amylocarpus encephaloides]|uniref:PinX1-related protein 1 n=1 Tax=Amylocarpus encephaloides TaxID=45428 RepID=A0A9P7YT08_9HELO|nr:hypothetical protein BJ875DRAFT_450603 [Amylocarpus encephaloides]